jgi:predicted small metal-binding protein
MSQTYEDYLQLFCVRCADVGLDCNCTIHGINEGAAIDSTILHMFENHAIRQEDMTACMRLKIVENVRICVHHPPLPTGPSSYNNHFRQ